MKTYKGTKKDLKCRDFQYEIGKEYIIDGKPVKCTNSGFHSCENPLDVFSYYSPSDSRYFVSEADGEIDKEENGDTKLASSKITLKAEVNLYDFIKLGVKYIKDRVDWKNSNQSEEEKSATTNTGDYSVATNTGDRSVTTNTGDYSVATNTGDYSVATNTGDRSVTTNTGDYSVATNTGYYSVATNTGDRSVTTNTGDYSVATNTGDQSAATNTGYRSASTNTGDYSVATNTGYYSVATNTGYQSVATNTGYYSTSTNTGYYSASTVEGEQSFACGLGIENKAKACLDSWIVLSEWKVVDNKWVVADCKTGKIDGVTLKPDTFYQLVDGNFIEVE